MQDLLNRRILVLYWIVLLTHCVFQFYELPYRAITKPLLVPLLLTYLLLEDSHIGKPRGKAVFYVGLFLAFFGDVFLILINDTFFLAGMIAFMLMNLCYSISFLHLHPLRLKSGMSILLPVAGLSVLAVWIYCILADEMGDYRMPVFLYLISLIFMVGCSVNVAGNSRYRGVARTILIPGTVIFMMENILVAFNLFHWEKNKDVYILIMFSYGLAQYLMVRGMQKAYPPVRWKD